MKKAKEEVLKIKIAISLCKLLEKRKVTFVFQEEDIAKSYNKIALEADIRKATVSDTFNGLTMPNFSTLILIIESMGFKLDDFSEIYYSINEKEISEFMSKTNKTPNF
ncbi:hypothetical protein ACGK9U_09240 [Mariniflexile sp. HNIBRBA6329]|uniref:hypothetical protein n=1 Tax=Mariniflexile sp. HNIBRBA6329 TaxID=3373088 RepID=UPI0037461DDD